jgi:hypothetical protein
MALEIPFQLYRGLKTNLPSEAIEGMPLVTLDTGELYVGKGVGNPLEKISDVIVAAASTGIDHSKLWFDTTVHQLKYWDGAAWVEMLAENITASGGLERTANDIHLAASVAGEGLGLTAGVLSITGIDCGTF